MGFAQKMKNMGLALKNHKILGWLALKVRKN